MKQTFSYLETHSVDPFYNLAFEEYILCHRRKGNYLILWQNENTIVVGRYQNTKAEIDAAFVEAHNIHVVRRATGGGAVYHDLGNLNYSFITDVESAEQITKEKFITPIVSALQELGLSAEASGRNDILVDGRKVSGTAQRLEKGRLLHHGTLLFDADLTVLAGALNVDTEKFCSKGIQSVRSRVGNIRACLKEDMALRDFWAFLRTKLAGSDSGEAQLFPAELESIQTLCREKYGTWDWNFGRSPNYNMRNKRYWPAGCLECFLSVEHGKVAEIAFYGDFLFLSSWYELAAALQGCPYQKEAFSNVLDQFPLERYFGGIHKLELLETIFYPGAAPMS